MDLAFDSRRGSEVRLSTLGGATGAATEAAPRKVPTRCVLFGDFELDLQEQALRRSGAAVKIPGKIYQAMLVLIEAPGDLVTRDQLRSRLWPRDANLNYDANVNTTVNKLRQVLGDTSEGSNFIQTVPRRGYCFVAPVRYADSPTLKPIDERDVEATRLRLFAGLSDALRSERARIWFTASVVTWVTAAILFGVMVLWHSHRAQSTPKSSAQVMEKSVDRR